MRALQSEKFAFVIYHTELSPQGIETISNIYPNDPRVRWKERWKTFQKDYLPYVEEYIEIFFKSARLFHPDCKCVVLTDLSTSLSFSNDIELHRYELDPNKPAYNRLLAQKKYLKQSDNYLHNVFLDYDMLVQQNLGQICTCDFDVALTQGTKTNRIGGSFIMVHRGSKEKGMHFFNLVEQIYLNNYTDYEAWGGIQVSMNDLLVINFKTIKYLKVYEIDRIKIIVLPEDKYNYPISERELQFFLDYIPEKMIIHFRGVRKKAMIEYWNSYLRPDNTLQE